MVADIRTSGYQDKCYPALGQVKKKVFPVMGSTRYVQKVSSKTIPLMILVYEIDTDNRVMKMTLHEESGTQNFIRSNQTFQTKSQRQDKINIVVIIV